MYLQTPQQKFPEHYVFFHLKNLPLQGNRKLGFMNKMFQFFVTLRNKEKYNLNFLQNSVQRK